MSGQVEQAVVASICFPDDPKNHAKCFKALFEHYDETEGTSGDVLVTLVIEDDYLVIDVGKGFHCLTIPLNKLKEFLK